MTSKRLTHLRWRATKGRRRLFAPVDAALKELLPKHSLGFRELGNWGRLGNQLFHIAGTIGIANSRAVPPLFPADWKYRPWYALPADFYAGRVTLARCSEAWPYLQDISLWEACSESIHEWLQPSERARSLLDARFAPLSTIPSKTCVHVRRGDYTLGNPLFPPCPLRYYELAVAQIATDDPTTQFLVFSDDIPWCRANLAVPGAIYIDGNEDWIDLFLMAKCEHHVIANSTFSWWGAFLSCNKAPIYPWLTGVTPRGEYKHYPDSWREIEIAP
jgi:hypothetical protein